MKITKLFHAALMLQNAEQSLFIDLSAMNNDLPDLTEQTVLASVYTHVHGDHYSAEHLRTLLSKNPNLEIFASADTAAQIAKDGISATVIVPKIDGTTYKVGSFTLSFFGNRHAHIVKGDDKGDNIGVVVNHQLIDPGDSFDLPEPSQISKNYILALPTTGPWLKFMDTVEMLRDATSKLGVPKFIFPIHDGIGGDFDNNMVRRQLPEVAEKLVTQVAFLAPGESIEA
ncbi:MAG: hypothetical protein LBI43_05590 [Streptococcaceae bacterium]|jgi:L-ascorbate metabolism protein UlaG (beta-lactamase superfamily)|nr:hypothetical protein [Streptococcaceae bacterium]